MWPVATILDSIISTGSILRKLEGYPHTPKVWFPFLRKRRPDHSEDLILALPPTVCGFVMVLGLLSVEFLIYKIGTEGLD